MSAQHTPGPWSVNSKAALIDPPDGESICLMRWPTNVRSEEETKANARLIAAAPELLEALTGILAEYEDRKSQWGDEYLWDKHEDKEAIESARAAINKAKQPQL